jgi:hypothetical protein
MIELRLRNQLDPEALKAKLGKILLPTDVDVLLRGPSRVLKPDGQPLCVYLPGAISQEMRADMVPVLQLLKGSYTNNRGMAAGGERISGPSQRTYSRQVDSAIVGAFEAQGPKQFCRLTAWTGNEWDRYESLWPLFGRIADVFREQVPERYANQQALADKTHRAWRVGTTPFTTITINNTYATAVHTDKGDLDSGFSTLAVFRSGEYEGGWLCFPEFRVGVDMQDGDVILMDAHQWHGNTQFSPEPKRKVNGQLEEDPGFERISVVCYYRTRMAECGSPADEIERRRLVAEQRQAALVGE